MARIRTIKPDFFLDENVAELPMEARLGFVGLWTQADKEGKLEDRPKMLKAVLFPYDLNIDFEKILQGLCDLSFISRYTLMGKNYIKIKGFEKHQRPHSSEPESIIPSPNGGENTPNGGENTPNGGENTPHGGEKGQERKGKEGKGRERKGEGKRTVAEKTATPSPQDFLNLWNEIIKDTPISQAKELSKGRIPKIKIRLSERSFSEWQRVFEIIAQSKFCQGDNDRGWKASFDWIISNDTNAVKVLEGKYDNGPAKNFLPERTRRNLAVINAAAREREEKAAEQKRLQEGRIE